MGCAKERFESANEKRWICSSAKTRSGSLGYIDYVRDPQRLSFTAPTSDPGRHAVANFGGEHATDMQVSCTGKLNNWYTHLVNDATLQQPSELALELASEIRVITGKLKRRLREHGGKHDLTPSQVSVVLRLESDGSSTVSTLARAEGMRPQSMSAVVAPLQDAGLVQGAPDPSDGRQTLMSLTPKCLKWLREGRAAKQDWLATKISQKLSAREQEKLHVALELLARVVEE